MKRWLRRLLVGLGVLAALLVAAVLATVAFVSSAPGARYVARRVGALADDQLAGTVSFRSLRLSGALAIEITDLRIDDPDGHEVLSVKRLTARLSPAALVHHVVDVTSLEISRPRLDIAKEGDGTTTLSRALAARHPKPPEPPGPPLAWTIRVAALALSGGAFAMRDSPGGEPTVALENLALNASGEKAPTSAAGKLTVTADLTAPGKMPLSISGSFSQDGDALTLPSLEAQAGSSRLRASGRYDTAKRDGAVDVRSR